MLRATAATARNFEPMDRAQALELLPESYARALILRGHGSNAADIATELGIVVEAVPALLRIADAKLARLLDEHRGAEPGRHDFSYD
jgi:DNA-directed RNA polymerase specialized sigma24 family protein